MSPSMNFTLTDAEKYITAAVPSCFVVTDSDQGLEVFLPELGFTVAVNGHTLAVDGSNSGSWEIREGYEEPNDSGVVNYENFSVVYPTLAAATFGAVDVLRRKEQDG